MPLVALGINHKTAPIELRERVAFSPERLPLALHQLCAGEAVNEAAILSTCNRTELYCDADGDDPGALLRWLSAYHDMPVHSLQPYIYRHPRQHAVTHMLRVAAGLDSMVLGEPQILGQVKSAYRVASDAGTLGRQLDRLFQHTFSVAKQVRTDTRIGESPVSVAFAAVSLGRQIFDDLSEHSALLIGAGETVELVAKHLSDAGIRRLVIANRTFERARQIAAPLGGYAIGLDEINGRLNDADIVISSTASPTPILNYHDVSTALGRGRRRPLLMIDIAVPRDIDDGVSRLDDVYLYTVDDLQDIVADNMRSRLAAAEQAETIIVNQTEQFMAWLRAQDAAAAIGELRRGGEATRDRLLQRARRQLDAGKDPADVLDALAGGLTKQLLHLPSSGLRAAAAAGDRETVATIKRLYRLGDRAPTKPEPSS